MNWTNLLTQIGTALAVSALSTFGGAIQQGATPKQAGTAAGVAALTTVLALLKQSPVK